MSQAAAAAKESNENRSPPMGVKETVRELLRKLVRYRVAATLLVVSLLIDVAYDNLLPLCMKFLVDKAILPQDAHAFSVIVGVLGTAFAVAVLSAVGRDYLYSWLGAHALHDIRVEMYEHLQRLSMEYFGRTRSGDLVARFSTDLAAVENFLVIGMPTAFIASANIVVSTIVLFVLEPRLALVVLVALPFCVLGPRILGPRAINTGYRLRQEQGVLTSMVQENFQAQRVIKAFSLKDSAIGQFKEQSMKIRRSGLTFGFYAYGTQRAPNIAMGFFNVLVLSIGGYLALRGELTVGSLVSFQALFVNVTASVMTLTSFAPTLLQATTGLQRIRELLNAPTGVQERRDAVTVQPLKTAIRIENVTFSYTGERRDLDQVSLEIPRGARVAFVGPSGCGKSTCLNLVVRFFDPSQGRIFYDDVDLRDASLSSLSTQMGVVFQENVLFNTSICENVRMGRDGATDAEVEQACRLAELHDHIMLMPQGYDSPVGEGGGRLSGGQRQRVAIARALIRRPSILVLDEATSALDPATEAAINDTLERVAGHQTTISVTHRLAPLVGYDRIFVFQAGRLMEAGNHQELLARDGLYADLWSKQNAVTFSEDGARAKVDPASLKRIGIFKDLEEPMHREIAALFLVEEAGPGAVIFREGDEGDKFYVIARGRVRVSARAKDGTQHDLAVFEDGDNIGEVALMRNRPRNATAISEAETVFLTIRRAAFQRLLDHYPVVRGILERQLEARQGMDSATVAGA
jgi:ATP-binding cassette, subfamily B, bacterial